MFKIVRTDEDSPSTTLLPGIHEFGRGVFIDCEDRRVAHRHGRLTVGEDNKIVLTALHKNPCFLKVENSPGLIVLSIGMAKELKEGDEFGLLPDTHWYRLTKNEPSQKSDFTSEIKTEAVVNDPDSLCLLGTNVEKIQPSSIHTTGETTKENSSSQHPEMSHSPNVKCEHSSSSAKKTTLSTETVHIDEETKSKKLKRDLQKQFTSAPTRGSVEVDPVEPSILTNLDELLEDDGVPDAGASVDETDKTCGRAQRGSKRRYHGAKREAMPARSRASLRRANTGCESKDVAGKSAGTMRRHQVGKTSDERVHQTLFSDASPVVRKRFAQASPEKREAVEEKGLAESCARPIRTPLIKRPKLQQEAPSSPTSSASRVNVTSGGSVGVSQGARVSLEQSPGGRVRCPEAPLGPEDFWNPEDCQGGGPSHRPVVAATSRMETPGEVVVKVEMDVEVDEGSEYCVTDDEEPQPVIRTINAGQSDREVEPGISELLSDFQDAVDAEVLPSAGSTFTWVSDYATFSGSQETFRGTPGPTTPHDTPYGNFCEIWDQEIMHTIVDETNRYAWQTIAEETEKGELSKDSRLHRWVETTVDEMYVLFAIFMFMAIDPRSRLEEYWNKNTVLEMPRFPKVMSYSRYIILTRFLHFVDNYSVQQRGAKDRKVAKLQPIIDHCNEKFQSCYVPHQYIAVDESLTLWKGHLSWIQNIMTKAARFGIKTYELCESHTGYLWKFRVYTGADSNVSTDTTEINLDLLGKTSQIVLDMVQDLHHKGYCLTMDNFYNSPALARHLKTVGIDCIGTLRISRKNVPEAIKKLTKETMADGAVVALHCGDLSVQTWKDAKLVTTISTFHDDSMYLGRRGNKFHLKPVVIRDYNKAMGGVDLKDQKLSMYLLERKRTHKWYIKMFKRLLNASILNSLVMHHYTKLSKNEKPLEHREFRHRLANELIEKHHNSLEVLRAPSSSDSDRLDGSGHFLYLSVGMCEKCISLDTDLRDCDKCKQCKVRRRRCARCSALGKRAISKFICQKCDKALCTGRCFFEYHTLKDLSG